MALSGIPSLSLGFAICLGGCGLSAAQFPHLLNNAVGMGDSEPLLTILLYDLL